MKPIIDISNWQRPEAIDYDKIASQIDGVILRAAYGTGAPGKFEGADPSFERHYAEFHKRGVPIGAYHYITEYQPIDAQVRLFIDTVKGLDLKLGYWCDVELEAGAERLTAGTVIKWMDGVEAKVGECGIYTGFYGWHDVMGSKASMYATRKLWLAAYVNDPDDYIPGDWTDYYLWQYTSSGHLDGYNGNLDMSKRGTQMSDILLNIPALGQRDQRWAGNQLGTSNTTIGSHGCVITSVTMMLRYFGIDTDPAKLNAWLKANGGYSGGNLFYWSVLNKLDKKVTHAYRYDKAVAEQVDARLAKGLPVIVNVDFNPATSYPDEHWVLVVGKVGGSYIINDPWYGTRFKLEEKYKEMRIAETYNFTGELTPLPEPAPEKVLYRIKVKAGINDLVIRGAPNENAKIVYKYANGVYDVFEEVQSTKYLYGRIGAGRWIALDYTERVTPTSEDEPVEPSDAEKLRRLWLAHEELH